MSKLLLLLAFSITTVAAEEWPRWRGPSGDGAWNPEGLPAQLDADAFERVWKKPIGGGYAGITVAGGRAYTMDRQKEPKNAERVLCFDAKTGEPLWEHRYEVDYGDLTYDSGPRASVTIHDGKAYTFGAVGHAFCLDAKTGRVIWKIDTMAALGARRPVWGFASSPVIWKDTVILQPGAAGGACYVAVDKNTGTVKWRAHDDPGGYSTPVITKDRGYPLMIGWTPEHMVGLTPDDGTVAWKFPYKIKNGVAIATPIVVDGTVLICAYWHGSRTIRLGEKPADAKIQWAHEDKIFGLMGQPLHRDGFVYLLDRSSGVICFDLEKGDIRWKNDFKFTPKDRHPQLTMVWADEKRGLAAILNANGEFITATLIPKGVTEHTRTQIIGKTWAHPAYVGNHVYARSDREIVCWKLW